MHLDRPGKADRLAHQALQPGAQRQRLPLARLRVTLARLGRICIEVTGVSAPIVRIIPFDSKRFQPGFELSKPFILATPKSVGQYLSTAGLDHRIGHFASMRLQKNERLPPNKG